MFFKFNGIMIFGFLGIAACASQSSTTSELQANNRIGGNCETCELIWVAMPDRITSESFSPAWTEPSNRLIINGTVFGLNGRTPAAGTLIYYWHTDSRGLYADRPGLAREAIRHGYIRGWIKSDANGKFKINTIRPAPYPDEKLPAHIHLVIKEPDLDPYYKDLYFDDDPLLIDHFKKYGRENRAGTEVLRCLQQGNVLVAEHHIVLGLNIPNYPIKMLDSISSGLAIGEDQPSFIPYHAWGPDKGSRTCPVCKYGRYHGILYFVGKNESDTDLEAWLGFLEEESKRRQKYLKAYLIYVNEGKDLASNRKKIEVLGQKLHLRHLALTYVPSFEDAESEMNLNKINPIARNTFVIYRYRTIVDKKINLSPEIRNFELIRKILDQTVGDYFHLAEQEHD
jgi:protocatechuate 3,4-dioxygenase, beta subunit